MFIIRQRVEVSAQTSVFALAAPLQYGDARAHEWQVDVLKNGNPCDLGGYRIQLYARRADNSTAGPIAGEANGARASATFPAIVYNVEGDVTLLLRAVKDASGNEPAETITLAALHARVARDTTDTIASEEVVVPNISELLAQIERMEEATDYANAKGDYAKEQGDYAKEQGDYAKEQGDYAKAQGEDAEDAAGDANEAADAANDAADAANEAAQTITQAIVPQFSVTVTTLLPEQSATASVDTTVDGTIQRPVLKLGIPRGQSGASNVNSVGGVTPDLSGNVPLSVCGVSPIATPGAANRGDVPLTPADLGAVPNTRTVNGKALSQDVSLDAEDVGALPADEPHLLSLTRYHISTDVNGTWDRETVSAKTYSYKQTVACQGISADDMASAGFDTSATTLTQYGTHLENFMSVWCVELSQDQVIVHARQKVSTKILLEVIR